MSLRTLSARSVHFRTVSCSQLRLVMQTRNRCGFPLCCFATPPRSSGLWSRVTSLNLKRCFGSKATKTDSDFDLSKALEESEKQLKLLEAKNKRPLWRTIVYGVLFVAFGSAYAASYLEQVPQTGRWRLFDIDYKELEAYLGQKVLDKIKSEHKDHILPDDHELTRKIRSIAQGILRANNLGNVKSENSYFTNRLQRVLRYLTTGTKDGWMEREWDVLVIDDPKTVNAAAVSAGEKTIIIYTGVLPLAKDDHGIAAIIGHEIAHLVADHTTEGATINYFLFPMIGIGSFVFGIPLIPTCILSGLLVFLPQSRARELEADRLGLEYISRACFDPEAAVRIQEGFKELHHDEEVPRALSVWSTHPERGLRIQELRAALPGAYAIRASSSVYWGARYFYHNFQTFVKDTYKTVIA